MNDLWAESKKKINGSGEYFFKLLRSCRRGRARKRKYILVIEPYLGEVKTS